MTFLMRSDGSATQICPPPPTRHGLPPAFDPSALAADGHCYWPRRLKADVLVPLQAEAAAVAADDWEGIFNESWPGAAATATTQRYMAATAPDNDALPLLRAWVKEHALPLVAAELGDNVVINSIAYIKVLPNAPMQHLHRDVVPSLLGPEDRHYSVFAALQDVPHPHGGALVLGSRDGLPVPWKEVPMLRDAGDMLVADGRMLHAGGTCPGTLAARYVAFVGLGTSRYNYNNTNPVVRPPYVAVATRLCDVCDAPATTTCFLCHGERLCGEHSMEECLVCRQCGPATQAGPAPQTHSLPSCITAFLPTGGSRLFLSIQPPPSSITIPTAPLPPKCTRTCPLAAWVHEDDLPPPSAGVLMHVGSGQLVALRHGMVAGVGYHPSDGVGTTLYRFDLVDATTGLVDPSVLAASNLLVPHRSRRSDGPQQWSCACTQVCSPPPGHCECFCAAAPPPGCSQSCV